MIFYGSKICKTTNFNNDLLLACLIKNLSIDCVRERERERERETDRQTDRQTQTDSHRQTDRQRQRQRDYFTIE